MGKTVNIGDTSYGFLSLAPMAGMSDAAFRKICKSHGADYMTTEMISAKALCFGDRKTSILARLSKEDVPAAIQIFGGDPDFMAKGAAILLDLSAKNGILPAAIDINMGCPVHKIVKNGEGSALMREPKRAAEIVKATVAACGTMPVTVKLRIGFDASSINVVEMAKRLEAAGAAALTVHARTREEMYAPVTHPEYIRMVKKSVSIPVIGNGSIFSAEDAIKMLRETGCDGIAVARGALGNPWLFEEIHAAYEGKPYTPPADAERITEAIRHFSLMVEDKGERVAVSESRAAIAYYTKGIIGSAAFRGRFNMTKTAEDVLSLLSDYCASLAEVPNA